MSATAFQRMRREQQAKAANSEVKKQEIKEFDKELEQLRQLAKEKGIKGSHFMGVEKLKEKLAEAGD